YAPRAPMRNSPRRSSVRSPPAWRRWVAMSGIWRGANWDRSAARASRTWRPHWPIAAGGGGGGGGGRGAGRRAVGAGVLLAAALAQLLDECGGPESLSGARTASTHARGFLLRLLPYDISGRFGALLTAHHSAWIFTSATLAVGEDFTHFASRLGLQAAATLRFESPFDYERQALLYLPRGLPQPSAPGYTAAVVATARPLLEASGGGAFLLFTSHRPLRAAALMLEGALPAHWPLLVQGRAPREQLLRRFRASGRAVLLGTASFWEGVDVQGPALRLVLIDRLPFASP